MYKIMFSAGETSGDMHGANLARALLEMAPDTYMFGFGGQQMQAAGVNLLYNMADYSVMGFGEVIANLPKLFRLKRGLVEAMKRERPDILVIIDYPDFNWRLAKEAKALGIPVFSYIPPSAWAWRKGRAKKCARIADKIAAIFPFELPVYEQAGADISFVGNPLLDNVKPSMSKEQARAYFKISDSNDNILLLPGSRKQELAKLLVPMLETAQLIHQQRPQARFFLPVAPGIAQKAIQQQVDKYQLPLRLTEEYTYDLMGCCDFAIATSGTVVLEAALMGLPSIVLYKMSAFTYQIAKLFVKIKYFSLPNILANEGILPELLQAQVNPETIATVAAQLYRGTASAQELKQKLECIRQLLGEPQVAKRTAALILETLQRFQHT